MARYQITVSGKGLQRKQLDKLIASIPELRDGVTVQVTDATPPESRADRLDEAMSAVSDAASTVEELRDELQDWLDNLPENLQQSDKAEQLQSAIDELENIHSELEGIDGSSVEFPGMF